MAQVATKRIKVSKQTLHTLAMADLVRLRALCRADAITADRIGDDTMWMRTRSWHDAISKELDRRGHNI
jgi:hypothetical protein